MLSADESLRNPGHQSKSNCHCGNGFVTSEAKRDPLTSPPKVEKEVAPEADPQYGADGVEEKEPPPAHARDTGHDVIELSKNCKEASHRDYP